MQLLGKLETTLHKQTFQLTLWWNFLIVTLKPGCPTFSIPVPIPKASLIEQKKQEDEKAANVDYQVPAL